jgi:hypothetical protein
MTRQTRRAGTFLVALGGMVAMFALLVAGPASAQTSGGATATGGSVASGEAHASNNSTASGESTAQNNSTASGCSTAVNNSVASGDDSCGVTATTRPPGVTTTTPPGGGTATTARPATPAAATSARLAVTGSWTAPLMAAAALAIALGVLLQAAGSERRRSVRAD